MSEPLTVNAVNGEKILCAKHWSADGTMEVSWWQQVLTFQKA